MIGVYGDMRLLMCWYGEKVEVEVEGDFGADGEPARNVTYRAKVTAPSLLPQIRRSAFGCLQAPRGRIWGRCPQGGYSSLDEANRSGRRDSEYAQSWDTCHLE